MDANTIVDQITNILKEWEAGLEREGARYLPLWLVVLIGGVLGGYVHYQWIQWKLRGTIYHRIKYWVFGWGKKFPIYIKPKIERDLAAARRDINKSVHSEDTSAGWKVALPENGLETDQILADLEKYATTMCDGAKALVVPDFLHGEVSGAVFNTETNEIERELIMKVFGLTGYSNPLWPRIFPQIRRCEAEVVEMTKTLLHGGPGVCGNMTTGGSMSIIQACLAYRNAAFFRGVNWPEMILPKSAHAAFYKAAELFRITLVVIEVEDTNFIALPSRIRRAINRNTCMIVVSAPNYPYGSVEDVEAIGQVALDYKVGLHVDACCGGFLIPFFDQEDAVPKFDFRVPGVTSISADTHKYGLCPKGSSVILYASEELRGHSFYKDVDWSGGIYASPTIEGSRNGSAIAVTWATLLFNGQQTLRASAAAVRRVTRELRKKISAIDGMELMGHGDVCIVAWRHKEVDNFKLIDLVEKDSKIILSALQNPVGAHLMVTPLHSQPGFVDRLIASIKKGIKDIKDDPTMETNGAAAMYGMTIGIPDRGLVGGIAEMYLSIVHNLPPLVAAALGAPAPPAAAADAPPAPENNEAGEALLPRDE